LLLARQARLSATEEEGMSTRVTSQTAWRPSLPAARIMLTGVRPVAMQRNC